MHHTNQVVRGGDQRDLLAFRFRKIHVVRACMRNCPVAEELNVPNLKIHIEKHAGTIGHFLDEALAKGDKCYAILDGSVVAAYGWYAGTKALEHDKRYANVEVLIDAADRFAVPEPVDMVWTAQNYHDLHDSFMKPIEIATLNAAIFRALKPGGVYLVIDHAAEADSGLRDTETLHRIDPARIRAEVTGAGFIFEAESAVLRNPEDSHLLPVFDPAIRHRTDQIVLRFRKPG